MTHVLWSDFFCISFTLPVMFSWNSPTIPLQVRYPLEAVVYLVVLEWQENCLPWNFENLVQMYNSNLTPLNSILELKNWGLRETTWKNCNSSVERSVGRIEGALTFIGWPCLIILKVYSLTVLRNFYSCVLPAPSPWAAWIKPQGDPHAKWVLKATQREH